jgi:hypothetical protein
VKIATSFLLLVGIAIGSAGSVAQGPTAERQQFIRVDAPVAVPTHVRIIDGPGAAALDDQTLVIADGGFQSIPAFRALGMPQPLRGWHPIRTQPKVDEYGNLGLKAAIPLGLLRQPEVITPKSYC